MNQPLTVNSFFAGIGGFDLGFEQEGLKSQFLCEINEFCQRVLAKHWPDTPLVSDITKLEPEDIPVADIWCGGFPCQDVSVARGSKVRAGLKGDNSGLFYPFAKLIRAKRPRVVLIENVTGLLSSHNGQDFRIVLETLTGLGYAVAWRIMNSRYFGAPQSRPRVFIAAVLDDPKAAIAVLYEQKRGTFPKNQREGFLAAAHCKKSGAKVAEVAYCLAATSGRHTGTDWSRTYVSYSQSVRRLTPLECEGIQCFPANWTQVEADSAIDDIDTPRYQALGNSVAVPVIRWIARNIPQALSSNSAHPGAPTLFESPLMHAEDFNDRSLRHLMLSDLHLPNGVGGARLKWQSGGLAVGDNCWDVKAPEAPSEPIIKQLIDVIEKELPAERYFISPNAAEGILRRVNSQNRTLFAPMHKALQSMVDAG